MISFENLPPTIALSILQKMELKSWIECRMSCSFVSSFVQENNRKFNFECPYGFLYFSLIQSSLSIGLTNGNDHIRQPAFDIVDSTESLAGLRFQRIEYHLFAPTRERDLSQMLHVAKVFKTRSDWVTIATVADYIGIILKETGCSMLSILDQIVGYKEYPVWLDQVELQDVTHFRIDTLTDFGMVSRFIRRFEYFSCNTWLSKHKTRNCKEEVNYVLKDLVKGLLGPRVALLKSETNAHYENCEFQGLDHDRLFETTVVSFFQGMITTSEMKVVFIVGKNVFGLVVAYSYSPYPGKEYFRHYLHFAPVLDAETVALFILQRASTYYPIDVSGLYEKLVVLEQRGEIYLNEAIHDFLAHYHKSTME